MRSVPPRGSGWVFRLLIANFRLSIDRSLKANLQSTIGNHKTHPLPRGGIDLMGAFSRLLVWVVSYLEVQRKRSTKSHEIALDYFVLLRVISWIVQYRFKGGRACGQVLVKRAECRRRRVDSGLESLVGHRAMPGEYWE